MKKSTIFCTIAIFLTIFIQGCATTPEYETFYNYAPPKTAEGRACIFQCELTRSQCEQLVQMRLDNCQNRAQIKYDNCEYRSQAAYDNCVLSGAQNCYKDWCSMDQCNNNTRSCDNKYNSCYSTCGGSVGSETRCVNNCETRR